MLHVVGLPPVVGPPLCLLPRNQVKPAAVTGIASRRELWNFSLERVPTAGGDGNGAGSAGGTGDAEYEALAARRSADSAAIAGW